MIPRAERLGLRTWVEVDTNAIAHNHAVLRDMLPPSVKYLSVVKSNAYGHGLVQFAKEAEKLGVDYFAADSIDEAIELRDGGIQKPIMVLGYTLPELVSKAIDLDLSLTVSSFELLEEISKQKFVKKLNIHIKIDTGMHRQGFQPTQVPKLIEVLKKLNSQIEIVGLYTHFAAVKNPKFIDYTRDQLSSFKFIVEIFKNNGYSPMIHSVASAGALVFPEADFDMARFGIAQHGIWPADKVKEARENEIDLQPTLEWKTLIGEVKNLPKGSMIGYDLTEEVIIDSKIAICPVGYWHGYPRNLSGLGTVLVDGKRARVLGRVSMDMIAIDVTSVIDPQVGDIVTLIGKDGDEVLSADEVANTSKCSVYELITRINPIIRRIYR